MSVVLEINTKEKPVFVEVDGKRHRLLPLGQLSLVGSMRVETLGPKLGQKLQNIRALSQEQVSELVSELKAFVEQILEAPKDVHEKLSDDMRLSIANAWMVESQGRVKNSRLKRVK